MIFFLGFIDGAPKTPEDIKKSLGGEFIIPEADFLELNEKDLFERYVRPMIGMMRDQYADRQKAT